jgi:hypothetical protein
VVLKKVSFAFKSLRVLFPEACFETYFNAPSCFRHTYSRYRVSLLRGVSLKRDAPSIVYKHFRRRWPINSHQEPIMVKYSLALQQSRCNEKSNDEKNCFIKNKSTIQLLERTNSQLQDKINCKINIDKCNEPYTNSKYLNFFSVQKIIHRLLTCNRIVLLPHIIPKITESELTKELNITSLQLKSLQGSPTFYKKIAKHINLPLINLYCRSALQEPELLSSHLPCEKLSTGISHE